MCSPTRETHITRDMSFLARGTHITRDMCFLGRGTHITRDMSFPGSGTHITRDMQGRKLGPSERLGRVTFPFGQGKT